MSDGLMAWHGLTFDNCCPGRIISIERQNTWKGVRESQEPKSQSQKRGNNNLVLSMQYLGCSAKTSLVFRLHISNS